MKKHIVLVSLLALSTATFADAPKEINSTDLIKQATMMNCLN